MWKHPRDEREQKNIKEGKMENGRRMKEKGKVGKERERERDKSREEE